MKNLAYGKAQKAAEYNKTIFDKDTFSQKYDENFRNLLDCQKKLGLPYIPILYKDDKMGFRLENMIANKINDCFKKYCKNKAPLFKNNEIENFKKFENEFNFERIKKENKKIKLQNKDNNMSQEEWEYKNTTMCNNNAYKGLNSGKQCGCYCF